MDRRIETDENEAAWNAHCAEMNRLYDVKEAELVADGWKVNGRGRNRFYTRKGQEPIVIRRQLGSAVWYTIGKDF